MAKLEVKGTIINIDLKNQEDYISITDIARYKNPVHTDDIIKNWLRNRNTIEFLGIWERLNNPDFKPVEFEGFRKQAGINSFVLTPKQWIEKTGAIGITSKSGRYGGTFAHKDIIGVGNGNVIDVRNGNIGVRNGLKPFPTRRIMVNKCEKEN